MPRKKYTKTTRRLQKKTSGYLLSSNWQRFTLSTIVFVSILTLILSFNWQFNRSLPHTLGATTQNAMQEGENYSRLNSPAVVDNVTLHGSREQKKIALTFDADMTAYMRQQVQTHAVINSFNKPIIDILEKTNTKATLFITGMWAELYPSETKQLANNPLFEIGSHSYSHQSFSGLCFGLAQLPKDQVTKEIGYTQGLLEQIGGVEVQFFRFPGGCYNKASVEAVNAAGEQVIHWDVAGEDGFNPNTQTIINNVVKNVKNGSIIVLHLNGAPTAPKTAAALPEIINQLRAKGYEFVKVNELLGYPEETKFQF